LPFSLFAGFCGRPGNRRPGIGKLLNGFCDEGGKTMPALFSLSAILYLPQIMNSIVSFPKLRQSFIEPFTRTPFLMKVQEKIDKLVSALHSA